MSHHLISATCSASYSISEDQKLIEVDETKKQGRMTDKILGHEEVRNEKSFSERYLEKKRNITVYFLKGRKHCGRGSLPLLIEQSTVIISTTYCTNGNSIIVMSPAKSKVLLEQKVIITFPYLLA